MGRHRWTRTVGALLVTTSLVAASGAAAGASRAAQPTGEPFVVGIVNSEGSPGLDFPDFTEGYEGGALYANKELDGFGGRPVELEVCKVSGTPESSQQCSQQLVQAQVDMVLVGLDVFTDFTTFEAAGIPVIGTIPILPGDYTQTTAFTTGGNLSIMTAMVSVAKNDLDAKTVGLVSTDNAAGNVGLALMEGSLDKAGIAYTTVKGGDNETDAGYQGLVRQATEGNPDLLISLYSGPGCVGTMRARAALGLDIPAMAIAICATTDVLDAAGDDATGWVIGGAGEQNTATEKKIKKYIAKVQGVPTKKANTGGFAVIGFTAIASVAETAGRLAESGGEITGPAIFEAFTTAKGESLWGGGQPYECGQVAEYPAVCAFEIPFSQVNAKGKLKPYLDGEFVNGIEYLP
ncbi:MAG: ABC transporter substrate-binding protein [Acidimicrobiia bacterium]